MAWNNKFCFWNPTPILPLEFDQSITYMEQIIQLYTRVNEIIAYLEEYEDRLVKYLTNYTDTEIANLKTELTNLNNQVKNDLTNLINSTYTQTVKDNDSLHTTITGETDSKLNALKTNLEQLINSDKADLDSQINILTSSMRIVEEKINDLFNITDDLKTSVSGVTGELKEYVDSLIVDVTNIYVTEPFRFQGSLWTIQETVDKMFERLRVGALTAKEYQNVKVTAGQYQEDQINAKEYQIFLRWKWFELLYELMVSPFTGKTVNVKKVVEELVNFWDSGLTCGQYDALDLTCEEYDTWSKNGAENGLTTLQYDWEGARYLLDYDTLQNLPEDVRNEIMKDVNEYTALRLLTEKFMKDVTANSEDIADLQATVAVLEQCCNEVKPELEKIKKQLDMNTYAIGENVDMIRQLRKDVDALQMIDGENVTTLIDNLKEQTEELSKTNDRVTGLEKLPARVDTLEQTVTLNSDNISELQNKVTAAENEISSINTNLGTNSTDISDIRRIVTDNATATQANKEQIDILRTDVDKNTSDIKDLNDRITSNCNNIVIEPAVSEEQLKQFNDKVETYNTNHLQNFAVLTGMVNTMSANMETYNTRHEQNFATLTGMVNVNRGDIATLKERVDSQETGIASLNTELGSQGVQIENLNTVVEANSDLIDTANIEITSIKNNMPKEGITDTQQAEIDAKIKALQDQIDTLTTQLESVGEKELKQFVITMPNPYTDASATESNNYCAKYRDVDSISVLKNIKGIIFQTHQPNIFASQKNVIGTEMKRYYPVIFNDNGIFKVSDSIYVPQSNDAWSSNGVYGGRFQTLSIFYGATIYKPPYDYRNYEITIEGSRAFAPYKQSTNDGSNYTLANNPEAMTASGAVKIETVTILYTD